MLLNVDSADGGVDFPPGHPLLSEPDFGNTVAFFYVTLGGSLSARLTDQQEALLGCGRFYDTSCDLDGVDLMNAEASAFFQSFPGFEGTFGDWDTTDASVAQPGTVGFDGGPVCTRFERGKPSSCPAAAAPATPATTRTSTGRVTNLVQPFTKQRFKQRDGGALLERADGLRRVLGQRPRSTITTFDVNDVLRSDGCSFRKPQLC